MKQAVADFYISREADLSKLGFAKSVALSGRPYWSFQIGRCGLYVDDVTRELTWTSLSKALVVKIVEMTQQKMLAVVKEGDESARSVVARLTEAEWDFIREARSKGARE